MSLFAWSTVLIISGLWLLKKAPSVHRRNILTGTLLNMEPAMGRAYGHIAGAAMHLLWLLTWIVLFGLFIRYQRSVGWQLGIGIVIWLIGTGNLIAHIAGS